MVVQKEWKHLEGGRRACAYSDFDVLLNTGVCYHFQPKQCTTTVATCGPEVKCLAHAAEIKKNRRL